MEGEIFRDKDFLIQNTVVFLILKRLNKVDTNKSRTRLGCQGTD